MKSRPQKRIVEEAAAIRVQAVVVGSSSQSPEQDHSLPTKKTQGPEASCFCWFPISPLAATWLPSASDTVRD